MPIEIYDNVKVYDEENPHFREYRKSGVFPSNLTFGFENEIVYNPTNAPPRFNRKISKYMRYNPYLYLKNEYSCGGVELNSHIFDWNWFDNREKYDKNNFINELHAIRNPVYFYIDNSCAFHVHLGRKFFDRKHLLKMVKFFYSPKNTKFLLGISGRTKSSFYEWASPQVPMHEIRDVHKFSRRKVQYTFEDIVSWSRKRFNDEMVDKACILNLYPRNTIEIRMFRGTTNPVLFRAYLEFALAISLFTKDVTYDKVTVKNFKKFAKGNIKRYKNLNCLINKPKSLKG